MIALETWQGLQKDWELAQAALVTARQELDAMVKAHLMKKGDPPLLEKLRDLDDLVHREAEARGAVDEFVEGVCC